MSLQSAANDLENMDRADNSSTNEDDLTSKEASLPSAQAIESHSSTPFDHVERERQPRRPSIKETPSYQATSLHSLPEEDDFSYPQDVGQEGKEDHHAAIPLSSINTKRTYDPKLWQSDDLLGPATATSSTTSTSGNLQSPSPLDQFSASPSSPYFRNTGFGGLGGVGGGIVSSNSTPSSVQAAPGLPRRSSTASSSGSRGFNPSSSSFTPSAAAFNSQSILPPSSSSSFSSVAARDASGTPTIPAGADMDRRGSTSTNASSNHSSSSSSYNLSSHGLPDLPSFSPASSSSAAAFPSSLSSAKSGSGLSFPTRSSLLTSGIGVPIGSGSGCGTESRTGSGLVGSAQASFSPLSPHVEPFSPSFPAGGGGGGSSGYSQQSSVQKYASAVGQPLLSRASRSYSLATPAQSPPVSLTQAHQRAYTEERQLLAASTNSVDTGYASHSSSAGPLQNRFNQFGSTYGRNSQQAGQDYGTSDNVGQQFPFENRSSTVLGGGARLRAFSETGALGIIPGSQYNPSNNHNFHHNQQTSNQSLQYNRPSDIPEDEQLQFDTMDRYGFPRQHQQQQLQSQQSQLSQRLPYGGSTANSINTSGIPSSASASAATKGMHVARSLESLDSGVGGGRYGYAYPATGPPSISDNSTDRGMGPEEISTIFVVGFPEDVQEREFQNMFLFARGFEAATLKIPASTAAARDRDAAAAAAVSAIAATLPSYVPPPAPPMPLSASMDYGYGYYTPGSAAGGGNSYDHLNNSLYKESMQQHAEGTHRVSSALAAAALSASATTANLVSQSMQHAGGNMSGPGDGGGANRKQIIGFAKFRTRDDAMEARDVLSGRKIDHEKGCVLKAEMAKKNLHVKRSPSDPVGVHPIEPYPDLVQQQQQQQGQKGMLPGSARGSSSALDRLAEKDREWRNRMASSSGRENLAMDSRDSGSFEMALHQQQHRERLETDLERREREFYEDQREREQQPRSRFSSASTNNNNNNNNLSDAAWDAFHSIPTDSPAPYTFPADLRYPSSNSARDSPEHGYSSLSSTGIDRTPSATASQSSPNPGRPTPGTSNFGKTLLQQLDEQEERDFPLGSPALGFGASAYAADPEDNAGTTRRRPPPSALPTSATTGSLNGQTYIDGEFERLALKSANTVTSPDHMKSASVPLSASQYAQHGYGLAGPSSNTPTSANIALNHQGFGNNASVQQLDSSTINRPFVSPTSPTFADFRMPRLHGSGNSNPNRPDDNNMPISTLYVGGLPAILPNLTGAMSASHLEESLREVFAVCPGFKRLSYRQKSQGPMCFVEFEDVATAARALSEMYGHTLNGLVKSGIRLAYSKNPLGVRTSGSSGSGGPGSPTPLSPGAYFASDMSAFGQVGSPTMASGAVSTPTMSARMAQDGQSHNQAYGGFGFGGIQSSHHGYSGSGYANTSRAASAAAAGAPSPGFAGKTFSPFSMH